MSNPNGEVIYNLYENAVYHKHSGQLLFGCTTRLGMLGPSRLLILRMGC